MNRRRPLTLSASPSRPIRSLPWHWLPLCLLLVVGFPRWGQADAQGRADCLIERRELPLEQGTLRYSQTGRDARILLLHGLFAQKEQWHGMLCQLATAGFGAIAPDLPGYGESQGFPLEVYRLERQVALLNLFMDRLGISRMHVAGNSMGGAIAALYAQEYSHQVRSLALIGAPLGVVDWGPRVKDAFYQGINPFIPLDIAQFDLELRLLFVSPPALGEDLKATLVKDYQARHRHYQQVWDILSLYDRVLEGELRIRAPTLILWGEADQIFPVTGLDRLQGRLSAQMVRLPVGHLPMLEQPKETAALYVEFLRATPPMPGDESAQP